MKTEQRENSAQYYLSYLLWYSLLFAVITTGVFAVFIREGRSFVWAPDALGQYVPKMAHFISETKELIHQFLSGDFSIPLYDFSIGMGNAISFHLEPLYWIALLFEPEDTEMAYNIIFLVRLYAAGLSMSVFALYFRRGRTAALISSFAYIFCDFVLWGVMRHTKFLIPMILLPLCIISMEEIYQKKRWYLCTVLIWIHLWCGYYFTYMDTIALGIYFLIRFFGTKEGRTFKNFWLRMRTIVCSYLLGVMIGNITLVGSFASYLTSSRTESTIRGKDLNLLTYGGPEWFIKFFTCLFKPHTSPASWMRLGYIPLVLVGIILLFMRKGRRQVKASFLVGTAFCMLPVVAFVFSGFSSINNRWVYIYSFVMAVVLAFTLEDMLTLSKKECWIITGVSVLFLIRYAIIIIVGGKTGHIALVAAAAMALTVAVVWFVNHKKFSGRLAHGILICLTAVTVIFFGLAEYAPRLGNFASTCARSETVMKNITDTPLKVVDEVEDDSFYRVATKTKAQHLQGASLCLDYNGIVHFSSTIKKSIQNYYRTLGLTTWSVVRTVGFDGMSFSDCLAAVKYYALNKGKEKHLPYGYKKIRDARRDGTDYEIFENEMALPIGYTYDSVISAEQLQDYDICSRQEVMMQTAVVDSAWESILPEAEKSDIQITGKEKEIISGENDQGFGDSEEKEGKRRLTVQFEETGNAEIYLYMKGLRLHGNNGTTIYFKCGDFSNNYRLYGEDNIYWTGQDEYVLNLGHHEEPVDSCTITYAAEKNIRVEEIRIFSQPMENMKSYTDTLKENVLEDVELLTNSIKGKITLEENKLLALSIPYEHGWKAFVDGEEVPLQKVNFMYMGLELTPGEHTIELQYHMIGLEISLMVSAAGILIFITALLIRRKRRHAAQHNHTLL